MARFFGTDGIRGAVGTLPMTPAGVMQLGWALGTCLSQRPAPRILIGADTRESGPMFSHATATGLLASGAHVIFGGVLPTPAVAYLVRALNLDAGLVISASHNPYTDNGIKYFSKEGYKLSDALEAQIEQVFEMPMTMAPISGMSTVLSDGLGRYQRFLEASIAPLRLDGLRVVVDTAHGASYAIAPQLLESLGATVIPLHHTPDGQNINANCGALYPHALSQAVQLHQADVGLALDGDGDRLVMADASGEIFEGDRLVYILAMTAHRAGVLQGGVVGTVMSNLGLEQAFDRAGIAFDRAAVGDRHILQKLAAHGWRLGGENSGHIICLDHTTTGDALLAGLQVLAQMQRNGASLAQLCQGLQLYPQLLHNVRIARGPALVAHPMVKQACLQAQAALGNTGRLVVRPSGTEPMVRIMLEGTDMALLRHWADVLAESLAYAASALPTASSLA